MLGYKLLLLKDVMDELGEEEAKNILSSFSCPYNRDVENFLRLKAIEFEKQSLSSTHLLYTSYRGEMKLAAYFTLAIKTFVLPKKSVIKKSSSGKVSVASKSTLKKIEKFGTYNPIMNLHTIPAPLIGQLGKNFTNGYNKLITGDELLKIACDKVWEGQRLFSGRIVYLECEDKPKLIEFYSSNGFVAFGKRPLDRDEKDDLSGDYLVQMLKDLKR